MEFRVKTLDDIIKEVSADRKKKSQRTEMQGTQVFEVRKISTNQQRKMRRSSDFKTGRHQLSVGP